jgi:hypothetical protein
MSVMTSGVEALIPLRDLLPFAKKQTGEGITDYSLRPFRGAEWEKVPKGDEGLFL